MLDSEHGQITGLIVVANSGECWPVSSMTSSIEEQKRFNEQQQTTAEIIAAVCIEQDREREERLTDW